MNIIYWKNSITLFFFLHVDDLSKTNTKELQLQHFFFISKTLEKNQVKCSLS